MNQLSLSNCATKLMEILLRYSTSDAEVKSLLNSLSNLIKDSCAGNIKKPMEWKNVPGGYYFNEGHLRKYSDLEIAYANFKIEITGGDSPALVKLRMLKNKI